MMGMTRRRRNIRSEFFKSDFGNALVELAISLPLLILFAIGVAEFGRTYFAAIAVANAARAGAQFGAQSVVTSGNFAGMNQAARDDANDLGAITVSSSRSCNCSDGSALAPATPPCTGTCGAYGSPQVFVTTTVGKTVTFLMRYPGLPSGVNVTRSATFRVE